jgi:hypothetical protein
MLFILSFDILSVDMARTAFFCSLFDPLAVLLQQY